MLSELAKLVQLDRVKLDLADREVIRTLNRVRIWPIDLAVAITSSRLDFKGDPGDEIIAATCIVHNVPLLTRDRIWPYWQAEIARRELSRWISAGSTKMRLP